jgi:hypothetical protein
MTIQPEVQHLHDSTIPAGNSVEQHAVNRPSLEDLLLLCDPKEPKPAQDAAWHELLSVGKELL